MCFLTLLVDTDLDKRHLIIFLLFLFYYRANLEESNGNLERLRLSHQSQLQSMQSQGPVYNPDDSLEVSRYNEYLKVDRIAVHLLGLGLTPS